MTMTSLLMRQCKLTVWQDVYMVCVVLKVKTTEPRYQHFNYGLPGQTRPCAGHLCRGGLCGEVCVFLLTDDLDMRVDEAIRRS